MQSTAQPDAVNPMYVFRGYAVIVAICGVLLAGWGPLWLGYGAADGWRAAGLTRVAGAVMIALACCAAGFAAISSDRAARAALLWFVLAHTVLAAMLRFQKDAIFNSDEAAVLWKAAAFATFVLFAFFARSGGQRQPMPLTTLFTAGPPQPSLHSEYEEKIRALARQEERNRLARDLHDSVKQQIFVIQTAAATAEARLTTDRAGAQAAIDQVRSAAREAMTEMQAMLDQLRAAPLENTGLTEAIKRVCEATQFRTGALVEFTVGELPAADRLRPGSHEAILRVAQEALSNAARHARATRIEVRLDSVRSRLELQVRDNGAGFDVTRPAAGLGIQNMRARTDLLGGDFSLSTSPGAGTTVVAGVPLPTANPQPGYGWRAILWAAVAALHLPLLHTGRFEWFFIPAALFTVYAIQNFLAWRRTQ